MDRDSSGSNHQSQPPWFSALSGVTVVIWAIIFFAGWKGINKPPGRDRSYMFEAFFGIDHVASEPWMWVVRIGYVLSGTAWVVYLLWWTRRRNPRR